MRTRWILSCEHGGNDIPDAYQHYFTEAGEVLQSHRGWDPGTLPLFEKLLPLADFGLSSIVSRLLVELNRSLHHPNLFSSFSDQLNNKEKLRVLEAYYHPYRQQIETVIRQFLHEQAPVYHISVHSFTPVLHEEVRQADIGLLYDPSRSQEMEFCRLWKQQLQQHLPKFRIRFNYPYRGTADGFTTYLRKQFFHGYAGIELEVNQKWSMQEPIHQAIYESLQEVQAMFSQ